MSRSKTVRALDCLVWVNGRLFALAMEVNWRIDYAAKASYGIDSQKPFEIHTTRVTVTGSCQCFRLHLDAGIEGVGLVPIEQDLSRERYSYLQIVDRQNDESILDLPQIKVTSQEWRVVAKGVMQGSFSFEAMTYTNEF